jgi:hypothetical protein
LVACEPAADLNDSLPFSASATAVVHSSDRNFTPNAASSISAMSATLLEPKYTDA